MLDLFDIFDDDCCCDDGLFNFGNDCDPYSPDEYPMYWDDEFFPAEDSIFF